MVARNAWFPPFGIFSRGATPARVPPNRAEVSRLSTEAPSGHSNDCGAIQERIVELRWQPELGRRTLFERALERGRALVWRGR